jgi:hypothetical protein
MRLTLKPKLKIFFLELFYVLSASLLIFSVLELFWPRVVLSYVNINKVLIIWLIVATIIIMTPKQE